MRTIRLVLVALLLAGCADVAPKTNVGPVTGNLNFQIGATPFPSPKVTTVVQTCVPPVELMTHPDDLPQITLKQMSLRDLANLAISDASAYYTVGHRYDALIDWIAKYCTSKTKGTPVK